MEREASHLLLVAGQRAQKPAARRVPQSNAAIVARHGEYLLVQAES
jgi:hypothetical protein